MDNRILKEKKKGSPDGRKKKDEKKGEKKKVKGSSKIWLVLCSISRMQFFTKMDGY